MKGSGTQVEETYFELQKGVSRTEKNLVSKIVSRKIRSKRTGYIGLPVERIFFLIRARKL